MKFDLKAYHHTPVHPQGQHFLGISWEELYSLLWIVPSFKFVMGLCFSQFLVHLTISISDASRSYCCGAVVDSLVRGELCQEQHVSFHSDNMAWGGVPLQIIPKIH